MVNLLIVNATGRPAKPENFQVLGLERGRHWLWEFVFFGFFGTLNGFQWFFWLLLWFFWFFWYFQWFLMVPAPVVHFPNVFFWFWKVWESQKTTRQAMTAPALVPVWLSQ